MATSAFVFLLFWGLCCTAQHHLANHSHHALRRMAAVLEGCDELCVTNQEGTQSLFFPQIRKRVNCTGIMLNTAIDEGRPVGPAPKMPPEMKAAFSYDGRVPILPFPGNQVYPAGHLFNEQYVGGNAKQTVWERALIDKWKGDCAAWVLSGTYGVLEARELFGGLGQMASVRNGGHVLVIGSENPWVEACALAANASMVTTLEYGKITSQHPQVRSMTPFDMHRQYAEKKLPSFDAVVTFSSVEHSGLGRYGDALNPWGDLQTLGRAWCMTKPKGELLIGVPTALGVPGAIERIEFNAHRVYGPIMYSHLLANWKQKWRANSGDQRVYVLERMDPV